MKTPLTPKQLEIAKLLASGLIAKEVAEQLHYSERHITNQVTEIHRLLRVKNRVELAHLALAKGWIKNGFKKIQV
jgi:DNA-binding CsgD family transcriptional regulator